MKIPTLRGQVATRTFVFLIVWSSTVLLLSPTSFAQTPEKMEPSSSVSPVGSPKHSAKNWFADNEFLPGGSNGLKILNIVAAAFIGIAGASAFYAGVRFGFISSESREQMLAYLRHPPNPKTDRIFFYWFGGVVAAIFQWAQPDVLAPIQAFVLGATWPSVVTRIMSGSTPSLPSASSIVNAAPTQIKADEKVSVEDAIVVVPRPAQPENKPQP